MIQRVQSPKYGEPEFGLTLLLYYLPVYTQTKFTVILKKKQKNFQWFLFNIPEKNKIMFFEKIFVDLFKQK